ncbi:7347_t:CDS:1, partial [Cetraspora pellucida]
MIYHSKTEHKKKSNSSGIPEGTKHPNMVETKQCNIQTEIPMEKDDIQDMCYKCILEKRKF